MSLNIGWDLAFGLPLLASGFWYHRAVTSEIPRWRQALFYAGLSFAFIVLVGPVPHYAIRIFWVHMVQHISLMMLISPMIILGAPMAVAATSERASGFGTFLRVGYRSWIVRTILKPQIGFGIFLIALFATHFSPLANAGMKNGNVHSLELIIFLVAGLIYYYPLMSGNPMPFYVPHPIRLASLFGMMVPETMTGFFLYSSSRLLHDVPAMAGMNMAHSASALNDQRIGGSLMWSMGMLIDAGWLALTARDWFVHERDSEEEE
ncbi:MAG: cytochrome c oxidase assembly protein [Actinobacteria bacterium]|nr:cytochrome c oxidase assembly protein [Actinomycetota bacterium]